MQSPLLQREWIVIEAAFDHYPELCRYMRGMIAKEGRGAARRWAWSPEPGHEF